MNETLHMGRMRVRYRVRRDEPGLRRRLDGLLAAVLADGLDPALARSGVRSNEEICIRAVHSAVRLRPDAGDAAAVAAWSAAIAEAVKVAAATGEGSVVRYRNRRAALVDLAVGIAAGDLRRSWAWRQLGLWRATNAAGAEEAAGELVSALVREPEAIVPVLAEVARRRTLNRLLATIAVERWVSLARAALATSFAPPDIVDAAAAIATQLQTAADPAHEEQRTRRILAAAALGRAALAAGPTMRDGPAELRAALAALAWLEAEPATLAASPPGDAAATVARAAAILSDETAAEQAATAAHSDEPSAADEDEPTEIAADRRWTTRHAGLFFLLGVVDELELPAEIASSPPLDRRPLGWTLHRLGVVITRAEPDDPGVLGFAGLAPNALPEGAPPSDTEIASVEALAGRIAERVRERLGGWKTPPDELLDFICRRHGEIVFEPGWIEVRLPGEHVSVELRRAGLDLDPGWLPWLGAVVRFVYV